MLLELCIIEKTKINRIEIGEKEIDYVEYIHHLNNNCFFATMKSTVLLFKGNIVKVKKEIVGLDEILCISFSSSFDKNHIYLSIPNKIKILNCDLVNFTIEVSQDENS